ncbi:MULTISPECIES: transcriptional regulator [unclassified Levilactobacillus]|uniref:transcriptional regulator n=1 Tax=unclassified Levilactobacillus TaxID=2767918 RepID=UPI002FF2086C
MTEQNLMEGAKQITSKIKISLLERNMSQVELSRLINENAAQVNRAIHADMSPKSVNIRQKIYRVLDIKE